ncbi:MAG: hypothetical protein ABIV06_09200 [Thermoanaerobaculia bacterium]
MRRSIRLAVMAFCWATSGFAHGPHKPAPPAASAAPSAAAIPLPVGWSDSRPPAAAGAMAPFLVSDDDGFLATWIEPAAAGSSGIAPVSATGSAGPRRVRIARWRGGYWTFPATVRESAALVANWADVPGAVRAADRTLYVWWLESSGSGGDSYDIHLARSIDQGITFVRVGVLHEDRSSSEHGFVSAVPEGTGVRFYYLDGRATAAGAPTQLRTVFVEGDRIGPSELVDESVCDCCPTSAVAVAGASAVAYRDRTAEEIRDVRIARRGVAGALTFQTAGQDGWKIAGCPVNGPALAANATQLAVAWFAAPGDRPRMSFARSADGGATWGAPQRLAALKPMGQLALAALGPGFAVAWLEGIEGGSELHLARIAADGIPQASQAIARTGTGRSAGIPRLASTGESLALLWVDPASGKLQFALTLP